MKYDKSYLRNRSLLQRKKKYLTVKNFNFNLIFNLISKHFNKKKIIIAGYYPSNYEVDILNFLEQASKKKFFSQISFAIFHLLNILFLITFCMLNKFLY